MSSVSPNHLHFASAETENRFKILDRYIDPSGFVIERLAVPDESQESDTFSETRRLLNQWDSELQQFENPQPPIFDKINHVVEPKNPVSERFYQDKSIQEWALLMPSARALYYLTHLGINSLPSGQPISEDMTRFMREMDDGIGIRTRKRIASEIVQNKIRQSNGHSNCLSLACGAADLMIEAIAGTKAGALLTLVDFDEDILSMARSIAAEEGLNEGADYNVYNRNLVTSMIRSDDFVKEIGEQSQLVVDAIGINEYFSIRLATKFLENAYRCVEPGGSLITANMLSNRSQMQINKTAIGWPKLYPRSIDEIIEMVKAAGLPIENVTIRIPEDGVYAVIEITKPKEQIHNGT